MIRSKGEAGTGDVVEADPPHAHDPRRASAGCATLDENELFAAAKELRAPYELVREVAELGKLPVVLFTAGGIATPADAAMMMQLGAEGVFVGSGIFKSGDPAAARRGDRQGDHVLRRPRRDRQGLPRPRRGDGRHQRRRRSPADRDAAAPTAAGDVRPRRIGVLALQGDVREHLAALRGARRRRRVPVRRPEELDRRRRPRAARRRVDDDGKLAAPSTCSSRCASASRGGLPAFGSCAGMILLADRIARRHRRTRRRSAGSTSPCAATPSAARSTPSRPTSTSTGSTAAPCTRSSSGRRGSRRPARASRCSAGVGGGAADGRIVAVRQGQPAGHVASTPSSPATAGCTSCSSRSS